MSVASHGSEGGLSELRRNRLSRGVIARHTCWGGALGTPWGQVQQARLAGEKAGLCGDLDTTEVSAHPWELCLP